MQVSGSWRVEKKVKKKEMQTRKRGDFYYCLAICLRRQLHQFEWRGEIVGGGGKGWRWGRGEEGFESEHGERQATRKVSGGRFFHFFFDRQHALIRWCCHCTLLPILSIKLLINQEDALILGANKCCACYSFEARCPLICGRWE